MLYSISGGGGTDDTTRSYKFVLTVMGVIGLAIIFTLAKSYSQSDSIHPDEALVRTLATNTARMYREGSIQDNMGSGEVVKTAKGKVLLTNQHICDHYKEVSTFRLNNEVYLMTHVLKQGTKVDLCAIELPQEVQQLVSGLDVADHYSLFERILALGFPLDGPLTPSFGFLLAKADLQIAGRPNEKGECKDGSKPQRGLFSDYCIEIETLVQTNLYIFAGNSGSAVVNKEGQLVGVVNSGSSLTNYGNIVPLEDVRKFLKDL